MNEIAIALRRLDEIRQAQIELFPVDSAETEAFAEQYSLAVATLQWANRGAATDENPITNLTSVVGLAMHRQRLGRKEGTMTHGTLPRISKTEALERLRLLASDRNAEAAHGKADAILLALINDDDIEAAYDAVRKWYA